MRSFRTTCLAYALAPALALTAGVALAQEAPARTATLPSFCTPDQKDPMVVQECALLAETKEMVDALGKATSSLSATLNRLDALLGELQKRDNEQIMPLPTGKKI